MNKIFALSIGLLLVVIGVCFVVAEEDADIEIVGLGDNCGDKSVCDPNSHLTCLNNRCRCDWVNGFILDEHRLECVPGEDSAEYDNSSDDQEDDENSSDSESETKWPEDESKWETSENGTEYGVLKTTSNESSYEYSSEDDQETQKKPEPKSVPVVENEKEKDEDDKKEETESSENVKAEEAKVVAEPEVASDKTEKEVWDDDDTWDWKENEKDDDSVEDIDLLGGDAKIQCLGNEECEKSTWGKYSSCDQGFCKCIDKNELEIMRKVVEVNGTCYLWKEMESECETHEECDAVIKGPAWCHQEQTTGNRFCTCQPFHVWDEESRECLPFGIQGINSPCVSDEQCSAKEALGPFGRCSEVTGTCQCFSSLGVDSKKIFLFQDKCWQERNLLERCETDQECEASLGSSAFCSPESQVCSCRPGHFCSQMLVRPTMSGFTMLVLIAIAMSFAISAVVCLVIRRSGGKSYVFVQQQNEV